jgi:magnesium-protoporphyrin O-methyltransferase
MTQVTYQQRRGELETYFDRTAVDAWAKLTTNAPVSGVRAKVRAGRDEMRGALLSMLPADLAGLRLLDAGCGTGAMAVETARRGAAVTAIDLSANLVQLAEERSPRDLGLGSITHRVGDMLAEQLGRFEHVVSMDSLIHYPAADIVRSLEALANRTERSIVFTFAPSTPLLEAMKLAGRLFPRGDRSPAIEPVRERELRRRIAASRALDGWTVGRTQRVSKPFYVSQAMEIVRR